MTTAEGIDESAWDEALHRLNGDLLQSWRWGEFKQRHGWSVARVRTDAAGEYAMAQVMFRKRGPFTIAYVPRGPVFSDGFDDPTQFWRAIDEACAERGAVSLVVEPARSLSDEWIGKGIGFRPGPEWFQTSQTVKVPLVDDTELLAQMRKDTRYNIQYAQRNGVSVEAVRPEPDSMETFYQLLQGTSRRSEFGIHTREYYADFMKSFGDQAVLLFAYADDAVTAALIAAQCGLEGRSMYAGSGGDHRVRGDAALLRFEAMRWTREQGGTCYDLGGMVPTFDSKEHSVNGTQDSASAEGVNRFKLGFGGEVVTYPPTLERRYHPARAWIVRRFNPRFREASMVG